MKIDGGRSRPGKSHPFNTIKMFPPCSLVTATRNKHTWSTRLFTSLLSSSIIAYDNDPVFPERSHLVNMQSLAFHNEHRHNQQYQSFDPVKLSDSLACRAVSRTTVTRSARSCVSIVRSVDMYAVPGWFRLFSRVLVNQRRFILFDITLLETIWQRSLCPCPAQATKM